MTNTTAHLDRGLQLYLAFTTLHVDSETQAHTPARAVANTCLAVPCFIA